MALSLKKHLGWIVFTICLAVFLFFQTYLIYTPIRARSAPVETNVAYSLILKAEQIEASCFLQDCPALVDLWQQFTEPTADFKAQFTRAIEYHRVFVVYHPLHSAVLLGLKAIGFEYEKAYDILALGGKLLIGLGIAFWLYSLFGRNATTIALLLLALSVFPAQGLHTVVPSNLALGLALFYWGIIISCRKNLFWALAPLLIGMVLLHPIGKLFGLIGILLYVFQASQPFSRKSKIDMLVMGGILALSFITPFFINKPELQADLSSWYPTEWNFWEYLVRSVSQFENYVVFWARPLGLVTIFVLLAYLVQKLLKKEQLKSFQMGGLLAGFLVFSLIWLDPWYGAQVLERAWVPMGVFLTGLIGSMVWDMLILAIGFFTRLASKLSAETIFSQPIVVLEIIFLLNFIGQVAIVYLPYYIYSFTQTIIYQTERMNISLSAAQPQLLSEVPEQKIIYMDEIPLYFYLANGGLTHGAIYYPAIDENQINSGLTQPNLGQVQYVVAENPLANFQNRQLNEVVTDDSSHIEISSRTSFTFQFIELYIVRKGQSVDLQLEWKADGEIIRTTKNIPQNQDGWIRFSQAEINAEKVSVRIEGDQAIIIRGIRFGEQATNWPWIEGITLTLVPVAGDLISVEISEDVLIGNLPLEITVIDDNGFTVLAEVE
jgi:hypothetical protein